MKSKQNILFRFSGGKAKGKKLGFGHVYRCLNLAKCLKKNNLYFLIEDFGGVEEIIRESGFTSIFKLQKNSNVDVDIKKSIEIIGKKNIDKIVIDKYNIQSRYLKKIKNYSKLIVISDLKKIDFPGDLVINGFIGFPNGITKNRYGVNTLTGVKFQIINKNFKKLNKTKKKFGLISTFGGFDEHGISNMLINEIIKQKPEFKTKVILGPATTNSKKLSLKDKRYITILKKTNNMIKEISTASVGLCSGGITSYEFASQKIPFGIICQEKHQLVTAKEWQKMKIATNLGLFNKNTVLKLRKFLENVSSNRIINPTHRICDGKGVERVSKKILEL